jgi:hypothetical protein
MDRKRKPSRNWRRPLIAAVAVLCLAALIAGWVLLGRDEQASEPELGVPTALSPSGLRELSSERGPVYWAGPSKRGRLEVTRLEHGVVYVRYLPPGVELGDPSARFTIVVTYPMADAYARLVHDLQGAGTLALKPRGGGVGLWRRTAPKSAYLAYPGVEALVEVYDPSPRRARKLARSGKIRRVP